MKYTIVIEKGKNNYSAYVPDLPGCISTGDTIDEVKSNLKEAMLMHIEGMLEDGDKIPFPDSIIDTLEVNYQ